MNGEPWLRVRPNQVLAWLDVLNFVIAADAVLDVVFVLLSTSVLKLLSVYKNNFNAFKFR